MYIINLSYKQTYGKMTEKSKHTSKTTGTRTSSKRHIDTHTVRDVEHVLSLDKDRVFLKDLLTQIGMRGSFRCVYIYRCFRCFCLV